MCALPRNPNRILSCILQFILRGSIGLSSNWQRQEHGYILFMPIIPSLLTAYLPWVGLAGQSLQREQKFERWGRKNVES